MIDNKEISSLRINYNQKELSIKSVDKSPFVQFNKWLNEALNSNIIEPNAMTLATSNASNIPTTRVVLLKGIVENGFIFYSNYQSKKGLDLAINPNASINFFWRELERQINITGIVSKLSKEISCEYFKSRPVDSRIAAWVSKQSSVIKSRKVLDDKFAKLKIKYNSTEIPMPEYWGGYILEPKTFEFWQGRENRLHDRIYYSLKNNRWEKCRLSP